MEALSTTFRTSNLTNEWDTRWFLAFLNDLYTLSTYTVYLLINIPNFVHSLYVQCELQCILPSPCFPVSHTDWRSTFWPLKAMEAVASNDQKQSKAWSGSSREVPKVRTLRAPFINTEDWSRCVLCVSVWSYDEDGLIMWQLF